MHPRNLLAAAIAAAATAVIAADDSEMLDTIFIKTQRGYSADATENSRDYSAFAATVGTKIPATPREIPQSISIVTNQQIKDRNVETLDQLARKTPGLRVLSNDDGAPSSMRAATNTTNTTSMACPRKCKASTAPCPTSPPLTASKSCAAPAASLTAAAKWAAS